MTAPIDVGHVSVEVVASARGFAASLRKAITAEIKGAGIDRALSEALGKRTIKVPVKPVIDDSAVPDRLPRPRKPPKLSVRPDIDPKDVPDKLPKGRRPPKLPVELDPLMRAFQAEVQRQTRALSKSVVTKIPVSPDTARLRTDLSARLVEVQRGLKVAVPTEPAGREEYTRRLRALVSSVESTVKANIPVEISKTEAARQARAAAKVAQAVTPPIKLRLDIDRAAIRRAIKSLVGVSRAAAGIGTTLAGIAAIGGAGAAGIAGLASAAAAAFPLVASLAAAAASAAGSMLALPGAAAVAAVGLGALQLGFAGVGKALKKITGPGGLASATAALAKLSPAARELVLTINRLLPAFYAMRRAVQQALLTGAAAELQRLARADLPAVQRGLVGITRVLNGQLIAALIELRSVNTRTQLGTIFDNAKRSIGSLTVAVRPLIAALLKVSAVGSGVVATLSGQLGPRIAEIANRLSAMADSGELAAVIDEGLATLARFGAAAADVAGIVRGIFAASGQAAGGGLLGALDRLNELVNSIAGQSALTDLFTSLSTIGQALLPVLLAVAQALGPVAAAVGDIAVAFAPSLVVLVRSLGTALVSLLPAFLALQPLVGTLASAFAPIADIITRLVVTAAPGINAFLGGLVKALEALAPAAAPVGQALGDLLTVVTPLLPTIASLATNGLTFLAAVLGTVAREAGPLIAVVSQLATGVAAQLLPVILEIARNALPLAAQAGIALAQALVPLIPVILEIARVVATQVMAALPQFYRVLGQLLPVIVQLADQLGDALLQALLEIVPVLPDLVRSGLALTMAMIRLMLAVTPLIPVITDLLTRMISGGGLRAALQLVTAAIVVTTASVRVFTAVTAAIVHVVATVVGALSRFATSVRNTVGGAISTVRGLPQQILNAIGDLGGLLYTSGQRIVQGLIDGLASKISELRDKASEIAGNIKGFFPNSPAEEGPLSGKGDPGRAGRLIATMLADGMSAQKGSVSAAAALLAAQVGFPAELGGVTHNAGTLAAPASAHSGPTSLTTNIYPQTTNLTEHSLDAVNQRQAIRWGLGRQW